MSLRQGSGGRGPPRATVVVAGCDRYEQLDVLITMKDMTLIILLTGNFQWSLTRSTHDSFEKPIVCGASHG